MSDYTVLKSSREELLKKAGYAKPHILYKLATYTKADSSEMDGASSRISTSSAEEQ
jgi:hypothetical protein